MAMLYKRGKTYWVQIRNKGKRRRISLQTGNYGVARAKVRKLEHELETRGLQTETDTPLPEIIPKFIEYLTARGFHVETCKSVSAAPRRCSPSCLI